MPFSIIQFTLKNFRCFKEEQKLSLVARRAYKTKLNNKFSSVGEKLDLLKSAVIYGANASGKTTILTGLFEFKQAVRSSMKDDDDARSFSFPSFALDEDSSKTPVEMELTFLIDSVRYNYGFVHHNGIFLEEWLIGYPLGQPIDYFLRKSGNKIQFSPRLKGEKRAIEAITRDDSLFLSAAAQAGHEFLREIRDGIVNINFAHHEKVQEISRLTTREIHKNDELRLFCVELLKEASAGIDGIAFEETPVSEMLSGLESVLRESFIADVLKNEGNAKHVKPFFVHSGSGGLKRDFSPEQESSGTRKLYALSGLIFKTLKSGGVLIVDELDTSMHELMAVSIIELFNSSAMNPHNAQIIFNTHNSSYLSSDIFRRDQVWFAEKDDCGASIIYPLSDFHPRKDTNLARGYLRGQFGAIPWRGRFAL